MSKMKYSSVDVIMVLSGNYFVTFNECVNRVEGGGGGNGRITTLSSFYIVGFNKVKRKERSFPKKRNG